MGNQKCKGAVPSFRSRANIISSCKFLEEKFSVNKADLINITDLSDCIKKYFKDLSLLLLFTSSIIKPNKLTSIPNQPTHQELALSVVTVPIIEVLKNIVKWLIIKGFYHFWIMSPIA